MISKQIEELINLIFVKNQQINYVLADLTFDWTVIKNLLIEQDNLEDISSCLKLKRLIDPMILESHKMVIQKKDESLNYLEKYSVWTNSLSEIKTILKEFLVNPEEYGLAGFLELVSIIEYSLGNVYYTRYNKCPPHLLKDLLFELRSCELFEENQIFILQILLGTSKGANLRNVAWHGFIEKIDPSYLSFLTIILNSYGKQLEKVPIKFKLRNSINLQMDIKTVNTNFESILAFPKIQNCNFNAWKIIVQLALSFNFKPAVHLLLSQIENLLRSIYSHVNNVDATAEINKYYVIMDSIFYGYILSNDVTPLVIGKITKNQELEIRRTHRRNQLLDYFPRSIFYMFYDLFYSEDGPRIRDKISHGEIALETGSAEKIFLVLFQFVFQVVEYHDKRIESTVQYESMYLHNVAFYRKFEAINNLIFNAIEGLEVPEALKCEVKVKFEKIRIETKIEDIKIHFRPYEEPQMVKMMLKILETLKISMENFSMSSSELFKQYTDRKLSTSRRKMLANLTAFMPNFFHGFHRILKLILSTFMAIQKLDDQTNCDNWSQKIIKMLKQILQLTQAYQKCFSIEDRNYFVANSKTCEFLQQTNDQHKLVGDGCL